MARIFKQTNVKVKTVIGSGGRKCREPVLNKNGEPVRMNAKKWTIEYRDAKGKVRRKVGYTDKIATEQLAARLEKQEARKAAGVIDHIVEESTRPITDHLDDYEAHLKSKSVAPRYLSQTIKQLQEIIKETGFGRLADIQSVQVERFLSSVHSGGRSPRTRNGYLESIGTFVRWAVKDARLPANPLVTVAKLEESVDIRRKRRAATDDELIRLVKAAQERPIAQARFLVELNGKRLTDDDRRRLGLERATIYKTLALTGIRESELRESVWGDVDLEEGWLNIRARVAKNSEDANIPLRPDLVADLQRWHQECGRPADDASVFKVPRDLCRVLKKDLKFAGIIYKTKDGYLDVHSLRHTTGTRLTNDPRVPTRTAQAFMRHSDPKLTTQTYTDKRFLDLRVALDALPDIPLDSEDRDERSLRATGTDDQTADGRRNPEVCKADCKARNLTSKGIPLTPDDTGRDRVGRERPDSGNDASHCECDTLTSNGIKEGTGDTGASPDTPNGTRTRVFRMRT